MSDETADQAAERLRQERRAHAWSLHQAGRSLDAIARRTGTTVAQAEHDVETEQQRRDDALEHKLEPEPEQPYWPTRSRWPDRARRPGAPGQSGVRADLLRALIGEEDHEWF